MLTTWHKNRLDSADNTCYRKTSERAISYHCTHPLKGNHKVDLEEASEKRNLQLKVIYLGLAIAVVMGLFPPWNHTFISPKGGYGQAEKAAGYHLIFYPPPPEYDAPMYGVRIDFARLLIQWTIVSLIAGGLVLFLRDGKFPLEAISECQSGTLHAENETPSSTLAHAKPLPHVITNHALTGTRPFESRAKKFELSGIKVANYTRNYRETSGEAGNVMVVNGMVLNESKNTVQFVLIGGEVYDRSGQPVRSAMCYAGNTLNNDRLSVLTIKEIQQTLTNKKGPNNKPNYLLPKSNLPFTLVFCDLPPFSELAEYRVAVMGFKSIGTFRLY
jgi:hypothetical protein